MFISAEILDDLLRQVLPRLLKSRTVTESNRKKAYELLGVQLELKNPRARLSRTETRGRPFSCLGELLWYLARTDNLDFIAYYISKYRKESEDGATVHGAYGPRLFRWRGINQVQNVVNTLRSRPDSRRAVIQIFDAVDLSRNRKEIPCTCSLQFMLRKGILDLVVMMRSNDAYIGLAHDVFCFTMLQEIVAREIGAQLGVYRHFVSSLHLYDKDRSGAERYLSEGVQESVAMPPMPAGSPWPAIQLVLDCEREIREGRSINIDELDIDPYWADLIRLLKIFALTGRPDDIEAEQRKFASRNYDTYIHKRLHLPLPAAAPPRQLSLL